MGNGRLRYPPCSPSHSSSFPVQVGRIIPALFAWRILLVMNLDPCSVLVWFAPCLEDQYFVAPVLAKLPRAQGARHARADDDDVVLGCHNHLLTNARRVN